MPVKDYYKTLKVPAQASIEEIKKAYRLLAQQHHPDKNNNDPYAVAYFSEIKEAYETLTNPVKKIFISRSAGTTGLQGISVPGK